MCEELSVCVVSVPYIRWPVVYIHSTTRQKPRGLGSDIALDQSEREDLIRRAVERGDIEGRNRRA